MINASDLLVLAISETKNLSKGDVFIIKDLFKGYEWNKIPVKERHLLGSIFLCYIKSTDIGIEAIEKAASGQQRYRKL